LGKGFCLNQLTKKHGQLRAFGIVLVLEKDEGLLPFLREDSIPPL
jgi:hypothetical protein